MVKCKHKYIYFKLIDNEYNSKFIGKPGDINLWFFCEKCLKLKIKMMKE